MFGELFEKHAEGYILTSGIAPLWGAEEGVCLHIKMTEKANLC